MLFPRYRDVMVEKTFESRRILWVVEGMSILDLARILRGLRTGRRNVGERRS